jgi:hypothetical protein
VNCCSAASSPAHSHEFQQLSIPFYRKPTRARERHLIQTVAAKMAPITRASSLILGIRVSVAEGPESRKWKTEDNSEKFQ